MSSTGLSILILAAGKGKRMKSQKAKVIHEILHRPMLHYVLDTARTLQPESTVVIVGHERAEVTAACSAFPEAQFCTQEKQLGTGDAVQAARALLEGKKGDVLVLSGDVILLRPETLKLALEKHHAERAVATVLTARVSQPHGYGRVLRNSKQELTAIREHADCSASELEINEVNSGIYLFSTAELFPALSKVKTTNAQGEYYLTDVMEILVASGKRVIPFIISDAEEMTGINDRVALQAVEKVVQRRINERWMMSGVTLRAADDVRIDPTTEIGLDSVIEGPCTLIGCQVGNSVVIEPLVRAVGSRFGSGSHIKQGSYFEQAEVGDNCKVGPYAHLRPGTVLEADVRIGNFVELKKTRMGKHSKANHLSYVGDATIGQNVNLGCGFITCNYDGKTKSETIIEDNVFIGSDSQTVAPVRVGAGSYIASGSTITENVPADSLVVSRGRQTTKPGYAKKYRPTE